MTRADSRAGFERCRFEKCTFTGARFYDTRFTDCVFVGCELTTMGVAGTSFTNVTCGAFVALGIALAATFLLLRRRRRRLAQEGRQAFARLDAVVGAVDAFGEHQVVPAVGAKDD